MRIPGIPDEHVERIHENYGGGKGGLGYRHIPSGLLVFRECPPGVSIFQFDQELFAEFCDKLRKHSRSVDRSRLDAAYQTALAALLAERTPEGYWVGELSTSALSTAVASSALALVDRAKYDALIRGGVAWLAEHQNDDGGWGDTVRSSSNISTTMLCRAAFHLTDTAAEHRETINRAECHLRERHGKTPREIAEAVRRRYGKDRTFSVPILMTSALAGLVSWDEVPSLPFELACFPQSWFRFLRLPVVSYALPALIAIGQAVYHHRKPWDPFRRIVRRLAINKSLRVLEAIQPSNGGFLEAAPLTSFVALGLASTGRADHPVVRKCVQFLVQSVRPDGSWPIDTNLSTWVTTLSVNALAAAGDLDKLEKRDELCDWLLRQQYKERHPFTGADPGAWAWTPLPGGVPDADDTPGALLALTHFFECEDPHRVILHPYAPKSALDQRPGETPLAAVKRRKAARQAVFASAIAMAIADSRLPALNWLLELQNADGGWPTFCRGWGKLPFDRSGSDLTAHALRAVAAWLDCSPIDVSFRASDCSMKGLKYLQRAQLPDGSWLPLWFGNQHAPDDINPTYGTARVLAAYRDLDKMSDEPARRGVAFLLSIQNADGGWGGAANTPSSVEETALAVEILCDLPDPAVIKAVNSGVAWLVEQVEAGKLREPTPIGFYFAKLWYFEKLYPIIFIVAALGRARRKLAPNNPSEPEA
jgi:squalene-hopene/tetraprenyl-beta-curcumene cyclase